MSDSENSPLMNKLYAFLEKRQPPKTFCPSEVVRALSPAELESEQVQEWRELMPRVRELIWDLRDHGQLEVLQKGEVLHDTSLDSLQGPIRVRRAHDSWPAHT